MEAILLVGGFGTRLMPLTQRVPKPLIPLANLPFVERQVQWLKAAGVTHVILSLHYNADLFRSHFSRRRMGVDISFAEETTPLGTGGAIKNCARHLHANRVIICNGDIFTDLDLRAMLRYHTQQGAQISIALQEVEDPSRFGVIETDSSGLILTFTEKPPRHLARSRDINAGIYIFEGDILAAFPEGAYSVERDIFPKLLRENVPMVGYREWPYWTDLGTPADYLQAHRDILAGRVSLPISSRPVTPGIWIGERVEIASGAILRPPVLIGDGARIDRGATVGPMVALGRDVHIHAQALVQDSIIWDGAHVLADSLVLSSIIGRRAQAGGRISDGLCEDGGHLIGAGGARGLNAA